MTFVRDPVSVMWDRAAGRLVARAYAARGELVSTRITAPSGAQRAWLAWQGINPDGPDNTSAAGGRGGPAPARTRWARGFVRAMHYANRGGDAALVVEVGRMMPPRGVIPAGRAVRARIHRGGPAALAAAKQLPAADRIYDADGQPGDRWSDPDRRDWQQ